MADQTVRGASSIRVDENRGHRKLWMALAALLLLLLAIIAVIVILASRNTEDAKKDVTVKACKADPEGGKPTASGQILNHSSKTSNYVVKVKFKDAQGNSLSEGAAPVKSVDPDKTAAWELTGARGAKGPVKCEISSVSRTNLPGQ